MRRIFAFLFSLAFVTPAFADSQGSATGGTRGTQSTLSGCTYNSTPPALTNGQQVGVQCGADGSIKTIETGLSYVHIATSTNTVVKAAPGTLHTLMLNNKGTGNETATLYDNTTCTGTVIGIVDVAVNDATSQTYDVHFNTGLCITTGGGTGAPDMTVSYR